VDPSEPVPLQVLIAVLPGQASAMRERMARTLAATILRPAVPLTLTKHGVAPQGLLATSPPWAVLPVPIPIQLLPEVPLPPPLLPLLHLLARLRVQVQAQKDSTALTCHRMSRVSTVKAKTFAVVMVDWNLSACPLTDLSSAVNGGLPLPPAI